MRERLSGLDGIRGLAALYVVFNHIFERTFPGYPADHAPVVSAVVHLRHPFVRLLDSRSIRSLGLSSYAST